MDFYGVTTRDDYDDDKYIFKNRLKECRAEKNISQEKLAFQINASRQTIAFIEAGKHAPSIILTVKIADFFGKKIEDIFYFEYKGDGKNEK